MSNQHEFTQWLKKTGRSANTARGYASAVNAISRDYSKQNNETISIYTISDQTKISQIARDYGQNGQYAKFGNKSNGTYRNAISRYAEFFVKLPTSPNTPKPQDVNIEENLESQESNNFRYENDLETAFCAQISELYPEHKFVGRQRLIGGTRKRIDVLLEHRETGDLLVVELKAGQSDHAVFGQISMYIGMLQQDREFQGKKIEGVIIVGENDDGLLYACKTSRNISVKTYRMRLELEDSDIPDIE